MAKSKTKASATMPDPAAALAAMETPAVKWKALLQIGGILAALWVSAFVTVPFVGYWGVGVVGVLTVAAAVFGVYILRLTRRSREIVDIMKGATDAEGRQRAIETLGAQASKDAMKALATSQLLAQTDPQAALKMLQEVDLKKAPVVVQDDLRAQMAMLHLRSNRSREARELVDAIRLDKRPDAKSKALYAAIMAEAFARTGSPGEARKLVETYDPSDPEYAEVRAMMLRARVYTYLALKKRGLAKGAIDSLADVEPAMIAGFLSKGNPPELTRLAKQALAGTGLAPKMKVKRSP